MTALERRASTGLAAVYGIRMLGLFLILPVFALYAEDLAGATPALTGIAIGIYGLTQAALQIPFGLLSDRIGRKPVIIGGLVLFGIGSVIAANADDIGWIIVGRAVQGSGAVAAAVMALASDLTRDAQRTKAMAMIGITIGMSFMLALIAGPWLNRLIGVPGIFWLTALLSLLAMAVVALIVPNPPGRAAVGTAAAVPPGAIGRVLRDPQLLRLDWGIFSLHLILTAVFLAVPLKLRDAGLEPADHGWLYLPVLCLSFALMVPFIIQAERRQRMRPVLLGAIGVLGVSQLLCFLAGDSIWVWGAVLLVFFAAFNLLEALLPSLVSKTAPPEIKGTAMGVYSSGQFLGAFLGGAVGGLAHQSFGAGAVFLLGAAVTACWLAAAAGTRQPGAISPSRA